jgi:hypothetical protein
MFNFKGKQSPVDFKVRKFHSPCSVTCFVCWRSGFSSDKGAFARSSQSRKADPKSLTGHRWRDGLERRLYLREPATYQEPGVSKHTLFLPKVIPQEATT